MNLPGIVLAWFVSCALLFGLGYWRGHSAGETAGKAEVQAEWNRVRLHQAAAVQKAYADRDAAEAHLARQLKDQSDAHTKALASRDRAAAAARGELARLRDILSRADASGSSAGAPSSAARSAPDDAPSEAGNLLSQCAGRLVDLGAEADGLAAQVSGLQDYARTAQQACGAVR